MSFLEVLHERQGQAAAHPEQDDGGDASADGSAARVAHVTVVVELRLADPAKGPHRPWWTLSVAERRTKDKKSIGR